MLLILLVAVGGKIIGGSFGRGSPESPGGPRSRSVR